MRSHFDEQLAQLSRELTEMGALCEEEMCIRDRATTLFFWIPIDIISFINWNRHKDREQEELTEVRRLTGKQEVLVLTGIVLWTVVVGYFLTTLEIEGLLSSTPTLETIVCYLDACASAVGIANEMCIRDRSKSISKRMRCVLSPKRRSSVKPVRVVCAASWRCV